MIVSRHTSALALLWFLVCSNVAAKETLFPLDSLKEFFRFFPDSIRLHLKDLKQRGNQVEALARARLRGGALKATTLEFPEARITFSPVDSGSKKLADISRPLSQAGVTPLFESECQVLFDKKQVKGRLSGWTGKLVTDKYFSIRVDPGVDFLKNSVLTKLFEGLGFPVKDLSFLGSFRLESLELVFDIANRKVILFSLLRANKQEIGLYLYNDGWRLPLPTQGNEEKDEPEGDPETANVFLLVDFGAYEIRDVIKKFSGFELGAGRVERAGLVLSSTEGAFPLADMDPVMGAEVLNFFGDRGATLRLLRGLNMIVALDPGQWPKLDEILKKINVQFKENLIVQGALSAVAKEKVDDEDRGKKPQKAGNRQQETRVMIQETLKATRPALMMAAYLPTWEFPDEWRKYFSVARGAKPNFFVKAVPGAVEFGVAMDFLTKLGQTEQTFSGAFECLVQDGFGVALMGGLKGVLVAPAEIPFAFEDCFAKFGINTDASFLVGLRGKTHLGPRVPDVGGNITIAYRGEYAYPKSGALAVGINNLKMKDIVDIANTCVAIHAKNWKPWEIPKTPIPMKGIYDAELKDVYFEFVTPGGADADLGFNGTGGVLKGKLFYNKDYLGAVKGWVNQTGFQIFGKCRDFSHEGFKFGELELDIAAGLDGVPHFIAKGSIDILGQKAGVDLSFSEKGIKAEVTLPEKVRAALETISPRIEIVECGLVKGKLNLLFRFFIHDFSILCRGTADSKSLQMDGWEKWWTFGPLKIEKPNLTVKGTRKGDLIDPAFTLSGTVHLPGCKAFVEGEVTREGVALKTDPKKKLSVKLGKFDVANLECDLSGSPRAPDCRITGELELGKSKVKVEGALIGGDLLLQSSNEGEFDLNGRKFSYGKGEITLNTRGTTTVSVVLKTIFGKISAEVKGSFTDPDRFRFQNSTDLTFMGKSVSGEITVDHSKKETRVIIDFKDQSILAGWDFSGLDLRDFKLENLDLKKVNFKDCDLRKVSFKGCTMQRVDLSEAELENAEMSSVDLTGANFRSANLKNAILDHARLIGANMQKVDAEGVSMHKVDAWNLNAQEADFRKGNLTYGNFKGSKFNSADITDGKIHDAYLEDSDMEGVDLTRVRVNNAILVNVCLRGSHLQGAILSGVNFKNANLDGANVDSLTDFTNARLEDVKNLSSVHGLKSVSKGLGELKKSLPKGFMGDGGSGGSPPKPKPPKRPGKPRKPW